MPYYPDACSQINAKSICICFLNELFEKMTSAATQIKMNAKQNAAAQHNVFDVLYHLQLHRCINQWKQEIRTILQLG